MTFRRVAAVLIMSTASAGSAAASQTLDCDIDDGDLEFGVQAALGSPANAHLNGVTGRLEWKARDGRPAAKIDVGPDVLAQEWIVEKDLRLRFFQDAEGAKPEVDLIVVAKQAGESQFRGTYRITLKSKGKKWKRSGRVRCELGY